MTMIEELLDLLALREIDKGRYQSTHTSPQGERTVVFGGEMLGQAIVGASRTMPSKRVKSVQTIFARGAHCASPLDITTEIMHEGRNLGSVTVSFHQDERLCARSLVLLDVEEPDLVRHHPPMPTVATPDPAIARANSLAAPETIIVGDVDLADPSQVGPASLQLWIRSQGAPVGDQTISQALLAYATDGWLIGTAMRPHAGVGQSMAHKQISTSVVGHTLSFHDHFDINGWLLIDHESVFAGGGRCHGRANVFTSDGRFVASFTQDALLRHFPEGQQPAGRERSIQ